MKKRIFILLLSAALLAALAACGSKSPTTSTNASATPSAKQEKAQPPDLSGEWEQTNSSDADSYQIAEISGSTITIYWYTVSDSTKALYWAGTFEAPTMTDEPYSWSSQNDKTQTSGALLASGDDSKTFTYSKKQISYDVSAMGVTKTVKLEKQ